MQRYTGKPGQWWNAPPDQIAHAYYRLLREVYEMPALDAWRTLHRLYEQYPEFMAQPMATLRAAIRPNHAQ
jgi:hypothetical protein